MNRALIVAGLSLAFVVTAASTASAKRNKKRHKKAKVQVVYTAPVATKGAMPNYHKRGPNWRHSTRYHRVETRRTYRHGYYRHQQARYERKMTRRARSQKRSLIAKVNRKCERLSYRLPHRAARKACRSKMRRAMDRHNNSRLGAWAPIARYEFAGIPRRHAQVVYYP